MASSPLLPEIDSYLHLLVILHLLDAKKHDNAAECSGKVIHWGFYPAYLVTLNVSKNACPVLSLAFADALMDKIVSVDRRTLDLLAARCYFYHTRCYELIGRMESVRT
jgi:26S proteasome regulatory subunit N3